MIYLTRSIPLLFGVPSKKASNWAIVISLLVMACSVLAFAMVDVMESFPFFAFISFLLLIHCATALKTTGVNLLFIFRYALVWVLIFAAAAVYALYHGKVLLSWFGAQYQTSEYTRILLLAGVFSLCGSLIGWHTSLKKFRNAKLLPFILIPNKRKRLRQVGYLLAFGFSMLYVWKSGGIVGSDYAYGSKNAGFELVFGVFNIFHFSGIALLVLSAITNSAIQRRVVLLAVLSLVPGMMAGSRADFLPQAFLILLLIANHKIVDVLGAGKYWRLLGYLFGGVLLLIIGYFVALIIAMWRAGGVEFLNAAKLIISSDNGSLIREVGGENVLFLETGNMMLAGLYSAIVQVQEGYTGLLFGESYLNYLLIAPPAFLGLPRPLGLEWFTSINGQVMTQGGIFEVSEAYWNFGLVGCFVVSFGLSYFFAWLLRRGVLHNNYFFLVWYFVFGIHGFRSIWYQNFSYFRLTTVMALIYVCGVMCCGWFIRNQGEKV